MTGWMGEGWRTGAMVMALLVRSLASLPTGQVILNERLPERLMTVS